MKSSCGIGEGSGEWGDGKEEALASIGARVSMGNLEIKTAPLGKIP